MNKHNKGDIIEDHIGKIKILRFKPIKIREFNDYLYTGTIVSHKGKLGKSIRFVYQSDILKTK